jgi:hypothetical protein
MGKIAALILLAATLFARAQADFTLLTSEPRVSTAVGIPVDLLIIPSGTSGTLLDSAAVAGFTLGGPGAFSYVDSRTPTHIFLTNAVYSRRVPFSIGGVLYSNNTKAILFNMTTNLTPGGQNEGFVWEPTGLADIYGVSATMTFKFINVGQHNFDLLHLQSTNYGVSQLHVEDGGYYTIASHSEPGTGGSFSGFTSNHLYNLHSRMNVTKQKLEIVLIDSTTGELIGAASKAAPTNQGYGLFQYIKLQDYLWNGTQNAQLEMSLIALDWTYKTFPLEPITVPPPENLIVTQTDTNKLRVTWTGRGVSAIVERNTNSTGWVTLDSEFFTSSIYNLGKEFTDTNVVDGVSYAYRITSQVGDYQSTSVTSGAFTVTNFYTGWDTVWQQETNEFQSLLFNSQITPTGQGIVEQQVKGINTSPLQVSAVELNFDSIDASTIANNEVLQVSIYSKTNHDGVFYGTSRALTVSTNLGWRRFVFHTPAVIPAGSNFWLKVEGNWVKAQLWTMYDDGNAGYRPGEGFDSWFYTANGFTNDLGGLPADLNFRVYVRYTPVVPTATTIVQTDTGQVRLGWQDSNNGLASYKIDRLTNNGTWVIGFTNTAQGATNIVINNLVDGHTNFFRIYGYISGATGSESAASNFPAIKINDAPFVAPTFTDAIAGTSTDTQDSNAAVWRQDVVAGNSGTCTKLRVWIKNPASGAPLKMALFDNSHNLLGQGTRGAFSMGAPGWEEVTLDTPVAGITMGTTYEIGVASSSTGWMIGYLNGVGSGYIEFTSYAAFPPNPMSGADNGSFTVAVGMGVVP